jgi:antitoxin (DNA-binding transcriptional repressor) of toxin-antitoxin stability system
MAAREIGAAKFKEQCLALIDSLGPEGIVITKHGKRVARLIPATENSSSLIGSLRTKLIIKGDVFSTGVPWDAES